MAIQGGMTVQLFGETPAVRSCNEFTDLQVPRLVRKVLIFNLLIDQMVLISVPSDVINY